MSRMPAKPDPIDAHVGRRVRERRAVMGMSQERLGDALGVTFQQIQKYERGANRIGSSRLLQIGRTLEVPVSFFFEGAPDVGAAAARRPAAPGLAEGAAAFEHGPAAPVAASPMASVNSREVLELSRAYGRIEDPVVRRRLLELARALGAVSRRGADAGTTAGLTDDRRPAL